MKKEKLYLRETFAMRIAFILLFLITSSTLSFSQQASEIATETNESLSSGSNINTFIAGFLLLCTIVGFIQQYRGKMIVMSSKIDIVLLFAPIGIILLFGGTTFTYIIWGCCIIGNIGYSITQNKGSWFNIILSILAKPILIILVPIILAIIYIFKDSKRVLKDTGTSLTQNMPNIPTSNPQTPKLTYLCEYCGQKFSSVSSLTSSSCFRHPDGSHKGKHKLYEGREKSKYTCKYCGQSFSSISSMTSSSCSRHPNGSHKGRHSPAL